MDGRYTILGSIAKGGMATVYLGRVTGSAGFSRLVAIKRLHPELAAEREFVAMLVDEARLASQIRHTNVADTLDLVVADGAFSLVLEYVEGDSLSALLRRVKKSEEKVPLPIAISILYGVLRGLDSAHDARNDDGGPLGIVHRDVSPQNILVGVDGIPRVIDFGVAKAIGRFDSTRPGEIRGKFSYMAPEQMQGRPVTRQVDVYSAGVVLWELLAGAKLFDAEDSRVICAAVLSGVIKPPSSVNPDVPAALDAVVLRATARELGERYLTARELLAEIEKFERASDDEVGAWVRRLCAKRLAERQRMIQGAPPSAEGRPIDELMADLAREGADGTEAAPRIVTRPLPAVGTDPESAHLPTAGGG
ncbi:MAG: eukaryotic-like serine/threonine-protein kinase, partial [Myxococcales bacterium]|nr:eukaryotic-like serine/threonine-protein kinase [Myxococcales bacterium]